MNVMTYSLFGGLEPAANAGWEQLVRNKSRGKSSQQATHAHCPLASVGGGLQPTEQANKC